jgi:hypothetical protein
MARDSISLEGSNLGAGYFSWQESRMNLTVAQASLSGRKAVGTISNANLLILVAWIVHLASWFLTALEIQEIGAPVAGWKAFRLAACGIWPCEGVECSDGAPRSACNPKRNHNAVVRIVLAVGCVARIATASTMVGMGCGGCLHFQYALDNHLWAATVPARDWILPMVAIVSPVGHRLVRLV